ncbi:DNA-3-methyladenine glycosylase I [Psychromicrobium xiongbiense]|uniref:DNA-3-methyladenine glycosylase I n=1 Tax=Psychromicrobium xiongbiense TaxID=3051184 RepID=UPI002557AE72|nr:DNA-3-methyladenine glycosylase I [Psychromicrobium sp. YIM S02556]
MSATVPGTDGLIRCNWPGMAGNDLYTRYHDDEWGTPISGTGRERETQYFERLSLEAFQSGLSWLTILRKREAFRTAFAGFEPEQVAAFTETDVARLLGDAGIVRNTAKITATIANARAILALPVGESLAGLIEAHRPAPRLATEPIPAQTLESTALAKALKQRGFRFIGPTTAYAMMQAVGLVNDHQADCWVRGER